MELLDKLFVAKICGQEDTTLDPNTWYVVSMNNEGIQCVALDAYVPQEQQATDVLQSIFQKLNERR